MFILRVFIVFLTAIPSVLATSCTNDYQCSGNYRKCCNSVCTERLKCDLSCSTERDCRSSEKCLLNECAASCSRLVSINCHYSQTCCRGYCRKKCDNKCLRDSECYGKYCVKGTCQSSRPPNYCDSYNSFCDFKKECQNNQCVEKCNCGPGEECNYFDECVKVTPAPSDSTPSISTPFIIIIVVSIALFLFIGIVFVYTKRGRSTTTLNPGSQGNVRYRNRYHNRPTETHLPGGYITSITTQQRGPSLLTPSAPALSSINRFPTSRAMGLYPPHMDHSIDTLPPPPTYDQVCGDYDTSLSNTGISCDISNDNTGFCNNIESGFGCNSTSFSCSNTNTETRFSSNFD